MFKQFSRLVSSTMAVGLSLVLAQAALAQNPQSTTSSPVAHVYVTENPPTGSAPGTEPEIHAYSADSEGRLTPISGSWPGIAYATTGTYLFATDWDGIHVMSYSVATDGTLKQVDTYNVQDRSPSGCDNITGLTLDHTGATLYTFASYFGSEGSSDCPNNSVFQSFRINKDNGALTYLGSTTESVPAIMPLTFTGNNALAFEGSGDDIYGFKRESDGLLVYSSATAPAPGGADQSYYPELAAADPADHLAIVLQPQANSGTGPSLLASYTLNSSGDPSTTNTVEEMPSLESTVIGTQMSPSGKLLAVSNGQGVQVYHFNGAAPITAYTGVLTSDAAQSMYWDNANHLYAVGQDKLYVFTVTPTGYSQAPGSPYAVPNVRTVAVRALTE
jgi:hypothetical protein